MKFDMSRAWDDGIAMLRRNTNMVTIIAGVFFFLPYLVLMLMTPDMSQNPAMQPGANDPDAMMNAMMAVYREIWWLILLMALLQGVGTLAIYALISHSNRPTVGEAIGFGFKGLLPFLGIGLLQSLALMLVAGIPLGIAAATGSILLISLVGLTAVVLVIYVYTKFSLSVAVIGMEKQFNPVKAMGRSWALTKGNSLRLWLFYFLLFLAFGVLSAVVAMVVGLVLSLAGPEVALFGNGLVSSLINTVFVCVFLSVVAAAYRQLSGGTPDSISETFD
ncbi:glycerophosphoryl diester phosphodiesterase membrane domain-containing protein [Parerythrobacter aestuarii]|uniref:glycerophosphoryl diester phosphodiesterase membrane domain-containing protein n=1 Tax=Parerythrobacter aestuarii TaxID=3020909 RepID=UPI0024DE32B0|nr:glycerophosphoryl diester phosphodiesterase membrane domain-containing protein [Parerythrobacter aestuarii]